MSLYIRERPFVKQKAEHTNFFTTMKKQFYLCVDLLTHMQKNDLAVGKQSRGVLHRDSEDRFTFVERGSKEHEAHPELHWRLLDRTKHGRVHVNARHVKVEFYIHHEDYTDGRSLADILASEIETMGESLSDMDMHAEVVKCM